MRWEVPLNLLFSNSTLVTLPGLGNPPAEQLHLSVIARLGSPVAPLPLGDDQLGEAVCVHITVRLKDKLTPCFSPSQ